MNMQELARSYLQDAEMRLDVAREALNKEAYHFCVRMSQEAVELALKGALRWGNIEPPRWHDVGLILGCRDGINVLEAV